MIPVHGTQVIDSTGAPVSNATIYFAPVLANGTPASYRRGAAGGTAVVTPVSAGVVSGAFSLSLPDVSATNPADVCFAVTVVDNVTGISRLGPGYKCVQPSSASASASWCSTVAGNTDCNFDMYTPNLAPGVQVVVGPTGPQGPPGCAIGSNCSGSLTPLSVNGVISADQVAGADIGIRVNTAFATCLSQNKSCKVTLPPGENYTFTNTIVIPGDSSTPHGVPQLDCQGSTLTWMGAGDSMQVLSQNGGENNSGYIANCYIVNGTGNTASVNAVHQFSRISFEYSRVSISGFANSGSSGILLDNVAESWGGYSERTVFDHVTLFENTKGIRLLGSNGGTNSFARTIILSGFCNAVDGQTCLSIEGNGGFQSCDAYDGFFDLRGNLAGSATGAGAARAVSLSLGGVIRQGVFNIGFEGPASTNLYYIDAPPSGISGVGNVDSGGAGFFNGGTSDSYNVPQWTAGGTILQSPPFQNAVQQALNAKMQIGGNTFRFGIPDDTFNYGYSQIYKRQTANPTDPEVDAEPTTGNTQTNLMYCNLHGCGFGAGYGPSATRGGALDPNNDLAYNGTFGNQAGNAGIDAVGNVYGVGMAYNVHNGGAVINTAGFGFAWQHNLSTTAANDTLVLNVSTPQSAFARQALILDAAGNVKIPGIAATTGTRYVCVDTLGKLISSPTPCSGT